MGNTQRTGTLTAASHTCSHRRRHRRKEGHAERGRRQPGGAGGSGGRYVKRHGIGAPELAVDAVVRSVVCHVARLGLVPAVVVASAVRTAVAAVVLGAMEVASAAAEGRRWQPAAAGAREREIVGVRHVAHGARRQAGTAPPCVRLLVDRTPPPRVP